MKGRLKSAVIGCGGIAQVHGAVLRDMESANLIACADIIPQRAQAFGEKFGARAYSSLEELLEKEQPEVVHLCTPHYLHTPMAKLCAQRGIHVFTEKPPVIDREQWQAFSSLGDIPGVRVGVCFQNRYNPSVRLLRELLESGKPTLKVAVRSLCVNGERLAVQFAQPVLLQPRAKDSNHTAPVLRIFHNISNGEGIRVLVIFPRPCPFLCRNGSREQFINVVVHLFSFSKWGWTADQQPPTIVEMICKGLSLMYQTPNTGQRSARSKS